MDIYSLYQEKRFSATFGKEQLYISERPRIHVSLSTVEGKAVELQINKSIMTSYEESKRYVIAKEISFDLLVSLYDVNTSSLFAFRATKEEPLEKPIKQFVRKLKRPNLELRAIGMQNKTKEYSTQIANMIDSIYEITRKATKDRVFLTEVDLFGTQERNIAIDTKLGMTFDILLLNRLYRPGELSNKISVEHFRTMIGNVFETQKQKA